MIRRGQRYAIVTPNGVSTVGPIRMAWYWHVRVPLCAAGLISCDGTGNLDASWLHPDWSRPLTAAPDDAALLAAAGPTPPSMLRPSWHSSHPEPWDDGHGPRCLP